MSSEPPSARGLQIGLAVLAAFVLAYSVLVATEPLLGIVVVFLITGAYLAWRFVHAFERIADALEAVAADAHAADD